MKTSTTLGIGTAVILLGFLIVLFSIIGIFDRKHEDDIRTKVYIDHCSRLENGNYECTPL